MKSKKGPERRDSTPEDSRISFASRKVEDLQLNFEADVNANTGAATVKVAIPLTPGRDDFAPQLNLHYNSSSGNSVYGQGWSLGGVGAITLSTRRSLPAYDATDTYAVDGAEELVGMQHRTPAGWEDRTEQTAQYWIRFFRREHESDYTRFEQWIEKNSGRVHWRSREKSGVVSVYGLRNDGSTRIFDPDCPGHVYAWLLEARYDRHGNAIVYAYDADEKGDLDPDPVYEHDRVLRSTAFAERYLKRIQYGNTRPFLPDQAPAADNRWVFQTVFDYGDHGDHPLPRAAPDQAWQPRRDPFSAYRCGFERRTYRLCRRILMFHHFEADLAVQPLVVGMTRFQYDESQTGSRLTAMTYTGIRKSGPAADAFETRSFMPLRFEYSQPVFGQCFRSVAQQSQENLPVGLNSENSRWVDLYGEGISGILTETNDAWYFKPNEGGGNLGAQVRVQEKPSHLVGTYTLNDFDSDGNQNLFVVNGSHSGFYEYDRDKDCWKGFTPLNATPIFDRSVSPQWLDLDGDGRADLVISREERFAWYRLLGKEGFAPAIEFAKPSAGSSGEIQKIAQDAGLDLHFADMSGDGMLDQVRIRNGSVEYWPHLGRGRFGRAIRMENAPHFDSDAAFDPQRIRLVDIDGSGRSDILYIGRGEIHYWINACGNRFQDAVTIRGLPYIDNLSSAQVVDLLGDGTLCLVWSTPAPNQAGNSLHYLPITGGVKPNLLTAIDNSLGKITRLHYGYSADHYLRDKRAGRPWLARIPRHVTVVERKDAIDAVGQATFTSLFRYHDGYFDSDARESRGFGFVEQFDSELLAGQPAAAAREPTAPSCIRTWYHDGAWVWDKRREQRYYRRDARQPFLPLSGIEQILDSEGEAFTHAYRILAGQVIRQETYEVLPDGQVAVHPYQVVQHSYRIRQWQPDKAGAARCYDFYLAETLTAVYEQRADDPRIAHRLVLKTDDYGNTLRECAAAYPRRTDIAGAHPLQQQPAAKVSEFSFVNIDEAGRYEIGIPTESKQFDCHRLPAAGTDQPFAIGTLNHALDPAIAAYLEDHEPWPAAPAQPAARLMFWERFIYWNDARTGPLAAGNPGPITLLHHREIACFSAGRAADLFGGRIDDPVLQNDALYTLFQGHWWRRENIQHYLSAAEFNLLERETRPDGGVVRYAYDAPYLVTVSSRRDALGNEIKAVIDYHLVAPWRITDPNDNVAEVRYDPLGIAVLSTKYGRIADAAGNDQPYGNAKLADYAAQPDPSFATILADPQRFLQTQGEYFYYELDSWSNQGLPVRSIGLIKEEKVHDGEGGHAPDGPMQIIIAYRDGFGRELQTKQLASPGPAVERDMNGRVVVDLQGRVQEAFAVERWLSSGHTVFNNKQLPVKEYEPFYSTRWTFEADSELQAYGVSVSMQYDALGRQRRRDFPSGTYIKCDIAAWEIYNYDAVDTLEDSLYKVSRDLLPADDPEHKALDRSLAHNNTPTITRLDPRGNEAVVVETDSRGADRVTVRRFDLADRVVEIGDPRGLKAFAYVWDMDGRMLFQSSIDAGDSWMLPDAVGNMVHQWDGRNVHLHSRFDRLGRPVEVRVDGALGLNQITEKMVYGESLPLAEARRRNARGQLITHYDQAGIHEALKFDFDGRPLSTQRRLAGNYAKEPDWTNIAAVALENPPYKMQERTDLLGRVIYRRLADGSVHQIRYLPGGGVGQVRVSTADGDLQDEQFLKEAEYNARGQRVRALLGNNIEILHAYDPETFWLKRMTVVRRAAQLRQNDRVLQDLEYTYDAVGNTVRVLDHKQQPADPSPLLQGLGISAENEFEYDAFYQLTKATGRVHQAMTQHDYRNMHPGTIKGTRHITLNNGQAIERYTRDYQYDPGGNIQRVRHMGMSGNWTTAMWTSAASNRTLPRTDPAGRLVANPEARFDANGNTVYLPHLAGVEWNYRNAIQRVVIIDRSATGEDNDEELYVYAADGKRIRKITRKRVQGQTQVTEKIYLDGVEVKRVVRNGNERLKRHTVHVTDGAARIAVLHHWSKDLAGADTDDINVKRIHYQVRNHVISSVLECDAAGSVITYEEYFPFGGTSFIAGQSAREIRLKDYRYAGKERDDETGFYYYEFRYYAPWIGNWLSPDPLGAEEEINLYLFVRNNPVNFSDPDGRQSVPAPTPAKADEQDPDEPFEIHLPALPPQWTAETGFVQRFDFPERVVSEGIRVNLDGRMTPGEHAVGLKVLLPGETPYFSASFNVEGAEGIEGRLYIVEVKNGNIVTTPEVVASANEFVRLADVAADTGEVPLDSVFADYIRATAETPGETAFEIILERGGPVLDAAADPQIVQRVSYEKGMVARMLLQDQIPNQEGEILINQNVRPWQIFPNRPTAYIIKGTGQALFVVAVVGSTVNLGVAASEGVPELAGQTVREAGAWSGGYVGFIAGAELGAAAGAKAAAVTIIFGPEAPPAVGAFTVPIFGFVGGLTGSYFGAEAGREMIEPVANVVENTTRAAGEATAEYLETQDPEGYRLTKAALVEGDPFAQLEFFMRLTGGN